MDFEKELFEEKEHETKDELMDVEPSEFTNIDGIYAKDVTARGQIADIRLVLNDGSYSTTERKIGKWIDGSDLYQRTFEVTGLSKNTWNNSILGTSDIKIVDFAGLIYWLDNQEASDTTPLNYYASGSDNCFTCINTAQTDMRIYPTNTSSAMSIDKAVITIKYTKISEQTNALNANIQQTEEPTDEMR